MADEEIDLGTGFAPQVELDASESDASATAGQGGAASGALSAEDAATINKRISDLRSASDRDRDQFKAALAKAEERESKLMEMLSNGGKGGEREADAAVEQARKDLAKRYDDGELTGDQLIGLLDGVAREAREGALAEANGKLTAAEQERKEIREAFEAMRNDLDPAYTSQKEKVDEAVEKYGVSRAQAMKIVADRGPSQPPRPAASGSLGTSVVGSDASGGDARMTALIAGLVKATGGRAPTEAEMRKHQEKWSKK